MDDEQRKSGDAFAVVQIRAKFQLATSDVFDPVGLELWDNFIPLADGAWSNTEGSSSDGQPPTTGIEVLENCLFEHAKDYSMLIRDMEYANGQVAYSSVMQTMGDRIRQLRQAKAFSQSQLADRVGVTAGAISQWENGLTKNIKLETFLKLCEELGTVPHYLIFGPGKQPNTGRRQA